MSDYFSSSNRAALREAHAVINSGPQPFGDSVSVPKDATPSEIVQSLDLNWNAVKRPMYLANGQLVESHEAMIRDDTGDILSVVGTRYKPMQNETVFTHFNRVLTEQQMTITYAGTLHEGRTYWAAARYEDKEIVLPGGDAVHPYLLLFHSHKPGNALRVAYSLMRFVCMNQLTLLLNDTRNAGVLDDNGRQMRNYSYSVLHSQTLNATAFNAMAHEIQYMSGMFDSMKSQMELLASQPIEDPHDYFVRVIGNKEKEDDEQPKAVQNVELLFKGQGIGSRLTAANGTYWGAVNAVTEYVDHHAGRGAATRNSSAMLGAGRVVKYRAFKTAVQDVMDMRHAA